ncbi:hypothetical protein K457DRAFT_25354 [Linnemannia elongata AG-77]|uniref:Uncharacterized protein n=1 Tax=Linnemannia elongata AG-77 TaxID=1314771 RepID=A0A197JFG3_9FUNG|nr:hypothetical protein K457DRAFT_25354 [Linnemannia elongata AG-77]
MAALPTFLKNVTGANVTTPKRARNHSSPKPTIHMDEEYILLYRLIKEDMDIYDIYTNHFPYRSHTAVSMRAGVAFKAVQAHERQERGIVQEGEVDIGNLEYRRFPGPAIWNAISGRSNDDSPPLLRTAVSSSRRWIRLHPSPLRQTSRRSLLASSDSSAANNFTLPLSRFDTYCDRQLMRYRGQAGSGTPNSDSSRSQTKVGTLMIL